MALLTRTRSWFRGLIFHVSYPRMKHEENSDRGDREAKRRGQRGTDLDLLITSDGRVVNTHWPRPMLRDGFRDPYGRIPPDTPVEKLTWEEVRRLRAGRFPRRYRIRTVEHALRHCARLGLPAVLEPKGDRRFAQQAVWDHIAAVAEDVGATVSIRAMRANAYALRPARRAGFEAWEI